MDFPARHPSVGRTRGVTLLEMMVVVVIIGILSAISVPKFLAVSGQSQLDGDANTLFLDMQWAKTAAIRAGSPYFVVFQDTSVGSELRTKWLILDSATKTVQRTGVTGVSVRLGLPSGVAAPTLPPFGDLGSVNSVGFQKGLDTVNAVTNGHPWCMNGPGPREDWADSVKVCGDVIGNMETGALYLRTSRSDGEVYAIVYNRSKSLALKRCRYLGGRWEVL